MARLPVPIPPKKVTIPVITAALAFAVVGGVYLGSQQTSQRVCKKDNPSCKPTVVATSSITPTNTPTPITPTIVPPTPSATPTGVVYPPPLPTPPAGTAHGAYIGVTPRDYQFPWDASLYEEIDCGIAKALSYYLAKQTGYTIWIDCLQITTTGDAIDLGSEPTQGRSGFWLDGFAGVEVFGTLIGNLGFKPAIVLDPDGAGPLRGGQGLNRNAVLREVEEQLGSVLLHNPDGSPRGIRIYSVRNGGGYAGGGTYCLTELRAQIDCRDGLARNNFGSAHIGDWGSHYYAGVVTLRGIPRPLSFENPLDPEMVEAMDWNCWRLYHDSSGRAGACDDDPRGTYFHEALHALCVDSHDPYISSPLSSMSQFQIDKFISCNREWIYPVSQEFLDAIR